MYRNQNELYVPKFGSTIGLADCGRFLKCLTKEFILKYVAAHSTKRIEAAASLRLKLGLRPLAALSKRTTLPSPPDILLAPAKSEVLRHMRLSFIVCTKNRAQNIVGCLNSIVEALNTVPAIDAEIVVVDNNSSDQTIAITKKWAEGIPYNICVLIEKRRGVSAAKNRALSVARGELLVFTDDDCRLDKNYVVDLLRHDAMDFGPVLRGGRVELGDPTDLPLSINTGSKPLRWHRDNNSARHENPSNSVSGCNVAMRREVANSIGPFDNLLGPGTRLPGGEDTDYIYRAYLANIPIEYVPDMKVFHCHGRKQKPDGNKLFQNYMLGTGALYVKYIFKDPKLCLQLYWDTKNAVKEIIFRKNTFLPIIEFSHKDKVSYCLRGAFMYSFILLRELRSTFN